MPAQSPPGAGNPVVVRLPGILIDLFPGALRRVEMSAGTVGEAIDELDRRWPGMGDRIRDTRPAIRKHMNVFLDGERATLETALPKGAEVFIITAISGG
ncbi:MoaD/ThiS family protein [Mesorhizobium sp. ZMM04-5]|uniref:MoaD/ThiS family protein n=1 Tax=Mesorhizobium marinum TaxID=3228790 RepID=A0ABV3QWV2_9HYPH